MPATHDAFGASNVWLYALIESTTPDPRRAAARALLEGMASPAISTQVVREVSVNLLRKASVSEPELRELVRSWYATCRVIEADEAQSLFASRLREKRAVSFWDRLIVAAALAAGVPRCTQKTCSTGN